MRKVLFIIILLLLIPAIGHCKDQPLKLIIKSDKQVYEKGEEIKIEATIKNNSDKEMIVFWSDEPPAGASGGGGTSLIIMPTSQKAYSVYIKPKEAVSKSITTKVSGPAYTLNYDSTHMVLDFKHRPDQEIFTGTLTSNTMTIKAVEKEHFSAPNSNSESISRYKDFLKKLSESKYRIVKGKLVRESQTVLTPTEEKEIEIITKALNAVKGKISIPEGAKVLIEQDKNHYVVIFENKLPEGARGGDYSAKVTIDSNSGKILEILGGE